jgi:hypothetical protein
MSVQGVSDRWVGAPVCVPDRGGEGEDALQDTDNDSGWVRPPCRWRSSWPLKVWMIDSMVWRSGVNRCEPGVGFRLCGLGEAGAARWRPAAFRTVCRSRSYQWSGSDQVRSARVWGRRPGWRAGFRVRRLSCRPMRTRSGGHRGCRSGVGADPRRITIGKVVLIP